jgi:hypothetical protein
MNQESVVLVHHQSLDSWLGDYVRLKGKDGKLTDGRVKQEKLFKLPGYDLALAAYYEKEYIKQKNLLIQVVTGHPGHVQLEYVRPTIGKKQEDFEDVSEKCAVRGVVPDREYVDEDGEWVREDVLLANRAGDVHDFWYGMHSAVSKEVSSLLTKAPCLASCALQEIGLDGKVVESKVKGRKKKYNEESSSDDSDSEAESTKKKQKL